jgi:hypothetical protein
VENGARVLLLKQRFVHMRARHDLNANTRHDLNASVPYSTQDKQPQLENGAKPGELKESEIPAAQGHINFFADIERDLQKNEGNADYEKEKKAQEAKEAKQLGIAPWGLGQAKETDESKPWYKFRSGEAPTKDGRGKALYGQAAQRRAGRETARKSWSDPMQELVNRHPQIAHQAHQAHSSSSLSSSSSSSSPALSISAAPEVCTSLVGVGEGKSGTGRDGKKRKHRDKKRKHKKRKDKKRKDKKRKRKRKRRKHESSSSSGDSSSSDSDSSDSDSDSGSDDSEAESQLDVLALVTSGKVRTSTGSGSNNNSALVGVGAPTAYRESGTVVGELRAVRLERERHERTKLAMLLHDKGQTGVPKRVQESDRAARYNQQFNPRRARQNQRG